MIKLFSFTALLFLMTTNSYAQKEWEYKVTVNDKTNTYQVRLIEETAETVKYEEIHDIETNMVLVRKKDGSTLNWKNTRKGNTIFLNRIKDTIEVNSTENGLQKTKVIDVGDGVWIQEMSLSLQWFVKNKDKDEQKFFMIRPNDLSAHNFVAKCEKEETIMIGEKRYDTIKVKVTLDGWLMSKVWSKSYWYLKTKGLYLKDIGNEGPGTPKKITELVIINP